jgi:peroxiredoxin
MANLIEPGRKAPDFTLVDGGREKHSLEQYRGRNVVVAFYILAFTGG